MGYHIITNEGEYVHYVTELENSGNYDPDTHFFIEKDEDPENVLLGFSTYDKDTQTIVLREEIYTEVVETEVRKERNKLLEETDFWAVRGWMTEDQSEYRQSLRDITEQEGFPHNVTWPTKPEA